MGGDWSAGFPSVAHWVSRCWAQRDSMFAQATQLGRMHNAGLPPDGTELQVRKLREVTAEQVQVVASKYFTDDNLTVATLKPQPLARAEAPAQ